MFVSIMGLIHSFATFILGLKHIIRNVDMGPDPSAICRLVKPESLYYEFLNSVCEFGIDTLYLVIFKTTIPATLIGLIYMIFNGLLCYGLIEKKQKFVCIWQPSNYILTIALLFIAVYVSYLLISELTLDIKACSGLYQTIATIKFTREIYWYLLWLEVFTDQIYWYFL